MKMKMLVGFSALLATIAIGIYFSIRSRDLNVRTAKPGKDSEAGWTIGVYQITNGNLERFGDGVARTNETSGQVLVMDLFLNTKDSQGRIVVNDEGKFIGLNDSGRNIWVDFTEPSGPLS